MAACADGAAFAGSAAALALMGLEMGLAAGAALLFLLDLELDDIAIGLTVG